tara:strand:- start:3211 stop:5910 length:2700 start_codon:yes stop_codon:yes gene_type:complete
MNISRGKIRKLRRSKSQSRRKLPKNKKKKRPRTGQNRSFRKKKYINLKNSSLKKLGKKKRRIRFQKGGVNNDIMNDFKLYIPNEDLLKRLKDSDEGKRYVNPDEVQSVPYNSNVLEFKAKLKNISSGSPEGPEQWLTLFQDEQSPFKEFFKDIKIEQFKNNSSQNDDDDDDTLPYVSPERNESVDETEEEEVVADEQVNVVEDQDDDIETQVVAVVASKIEEKTSENIDETKEDGNVNDSSNKSDNTKQPCDEYDLWLKYYKTQNPTISKPKEPAKGGMTGLSKYKKKCHTAYIKIINEIEKYFGTDKQEVSIVGGWGSDIKKVFEFVFKTHSRDLWDETGTSKQNEEYFTYDFIKVKEYIIYVFHLVIWHGEKERKPNQPLKEEPIDIVLSHLFEAYGNLQEEYMYGVFIEYIAKSIPNCKFKQMRKLYPYDPTGTVNAKLGPKLYMNNIIARRNAKINQANSLKIPRNNYFETVDELHSMRSKLETHIKEKGNVSLAKTPAITLLKQGNLFRVKYRYPFISGRFEQNYSTEMNPQSLTFKPGTSWEDKPKPSKTSLIPFKTKHDEADYVKVVFDVNLKTPNKSNMQKFTIYVPKTSLTYTDKLSEVNLQFKDLYEEKNSKIFFGKTSKQGIKRKLFVKFYQPIDIKISGAQDCMANSVDSGVFSSLEAIKARQAKEANQRINKLKLDLNKSKMNEGDATLCTNKIRDMEADLLENNAMTISYDPASKNVYVSKVENLTDFAESLKINLDELHDINTNTQDPISHQNKVDSNARTTQMVKDEGMDKKTIMSKSPTIQTPNIIKKRVTPGTSSSTSSDSTATSTTTKTEKAPDAESATTTSTTTKTEKAPDAETDKTEESSKELDNTESISVIVSDVPDAETKKENENENENETTIPNK